MTQRIVDFGFSVADAEQPVLSFDEGVLKLCFRDWKEQPVEAKFYGVLAFTWQDAEQLEAGEPSGGCVEVFGSDWREMHVAQGLADTPECLRHVVLNFNVQGKLSVLFERNVEVDSVAP